MKGEFDLGIIGAGPAGLAAAIAGSSEGLSTVIFELDKDGYGGQPQESGAIENYLGFPEGIRGDTLSAAGRDQAVKFGTELVAPCRIIRLDKGDAGKKILVSEEGDQYGCRAIIIASGLQYRRLEAKGISRFSGEGIFYTPPSLRDDFRGKCVYIVGAKNSAAQAAETLRKSPGCEIHLVARNDALSGMSQYLIDRIVNRTDVHLHYSTQIVEALGHKSLEKLVLQGPEGTREVKADYLYVMIGAIPKTEWLNGTVGRDDKGFILTGNDAPGGWWKQMRPQLPMETTFPGVFAAGDVRNGSIKRYIIAAAEGTFALQNVHQYLGFKEG
jgi:thioredoxin reductase (NADPH)